MSALAALFRADSKLATTVRGFAPRQSQTRMAEAVEQALQQRSQLVVEAETGTGKTFAYLVPTLLSQGKAIISTGTKNLQEQLFHRDLPALRAVLAPAKQVALLKGRGNYLCLHRLDQALTRAGEYSAQQQRQLVTVRSWAQRTEDGDVGSINVLQEDAEVLPLVTSTAENCLGRDCPSFDDCYVVKARKKALEADLVVVNHHLFFADMALKDVGFGELIPAADAVIFDEAHQLPDIASQYFGEAFSSRQLQELAHELKVLYLTTLKDLKQLDKAADQVLASLRDLRLLFGVDAHKGNWRRARQRAEMQAQGALLEQHLEFLLEVMQNALGRSLDLDNGYQRAQLMLEIWQRLQATERTGYSFWYETTPRQFTLHQTPLSVAEKFGSYLQQSERAWVFTSATLAVNDSFQHFTELLGLAQPATLCLPSPFDFQQQALLCLPRYLPQPQHPQMLQALLDIITQVLDANQHGGTFVLFTSHRQLQAVAQALALLTERPLLVQGSSSKRDLLAQFIAAGNGVLLGTSSFWEGVDVRGDALRCVIIDKLPFASPDDPLLSARVEDCQLRGVDAFAQVQLPQAVIALKQGAGRLIRDSHDRGVLIVCDQRLVSKPYGGVFLHSLPNMRRSRDLAEALNFLRQPSQEFANTHDA